jgi:hypothetical protein
VMNSLWVCLWERDNRFFCSSYHLCRKKSRPHY